MVGVSLADAATQQLLLAALREHRDAVERAAGCRVRTGTRLLPQLQLVVAGSGVAGGKWVTVSGPEGKRSGSVLMMVYGICMQTYLTCGDMYRGVRGTCMQAYNGSCPY